MPQDDEGHMSVMDQPARGRGRPGANRATMLEALAGIRRAVRAKRRPPRYRPAPVERGSGIVASTGTEKLEETASTQPMHEAELPRMAGPAPDAAPPGEPRRRMSAWAVIGVAFAVVVGAATYAISSAVPATYQSSTQVQITVNASSGLGQDSTLASNSLTAQYVQLATTDAVLGRPAAQLGLSISALRSNLSVGTVAQQNLLQISARARSADEAQRRAAVVTRDFVAYVLRDARRKLTSYSAAVSAQMRQINRRIAQITSQLGPAQPGNTAQSLGLDSELGALTTQQQTLRNQLTQHLASSVPSVQQVQSAGQGSKVSPKPLLYAIVGLLVAAFVAAQVVVLVGRRRRTS